MNALHLHQLISQILLMCSFDPFCRSHAVSIVVLAHNSKRCAFTLTFFLASNFFVLFNLSLWRFDGHPVTTDYGWYSRDAHRVRRRRLHGSSGEHGCNLVRTARVSVRHDRACLQGVRNARNVSGIWRFGHWLSGLDWDVGCCLLGCRSYSLMRILAS